jgi:hypothetical protein
VKPSQLVDQLLEERKQGILERAMLFRELLITETERKMMGHQAGWRLEELALAAEGDPEAQARLETAYQAIVNARRSLEAKGQWRGR